jgi:hypothetical protein
MMKNISSLIAASGCFNLDEALHAVAELHIPEGTLVHRCQEDKKPWPCPTVSTIKKELTKQ